MMDEAEGLPEQIGTPAGVRLMSPMHESPCNSGPTDGPHLLSPLPPPGRRGWQRLKPRFGIGSRLAVGLAAITGVILIGRAPVTETTREAVEAVRSIQNEDEPLARRASSVLEKLIAYDRAVGASLQDGHTSNVGAITVPGGALAAAVTGFFDGTPRPTLSAEIGRASCRERV